MFHGFFDPENGLFSTLSLLVDLVGLSVCWVFLCLPAVTAGPATAALYYTVVKRFRQGERNTFTLFLRSFLRELKRGCLCTLLLIPAFALLGGLHRWYALAADTQGWLGLAAYSYFYMVLALLLALTLWLFPLLARFELSVGRLFSTAARLALAHLPTTLLLLLLTAGAWVAIACFLPLMFLAPTVWALLLSFPLERAFSRHLPGDDN